MNERMVLIRRGLLGCVYKHIVACCAGWVSFIKWVFIGKISAPFFNLNQANKYFIPFQNNVQWGSVRQWKWVKIETQKKMNVKK